MSNATILISTFRNSSIRASAGRLRRSGICQARTGQSKGGGYVIGKGRGYKMRLERKAGQGDHIRHIRSFWRIWALADGQQRSTGGL